MDVVDSSQASQPARDDANVASQRDASGDLPVGEPAVDAAAASSDAQAHHDASAQLPVDLDVNCDEHDILCRRARPPCPSQQVPEVVDGCWGDCVSISACVCHQPDECPQVEQYACHRHAQHCGPYVN